jgi:high-affinity nickel permease
VPSPVPSKTSARAGPRKLLEQGKRPVGTGFFFSLGHSTIVFVLTAGLALAASHVVSGMPAFQHWGGYVGGTVSGTFLCALGVLNLIVLVGILGRSFGLISATWHMYPLGTCSASASTPRRRSG